MVLRWTGKGAVESPNTLQVRVGAKFGSRVRADAPTPTRGLAPDEVLDNARYFAKRGGNRETTVDRLVLSAVGSADWFKRRSGQLRMLGFKHITLHLEPEVASTLLTQLSPDEVDAVATSPRTPLQVRQITGVSADFHLVLVFPLDRLTANQVDELVGQVIKTPPSRVVLTWSLTSEAAPANIDELASRLSAPIDLLLEAGVAISIKGVPPCAFREPKTPQNKSRNRWYVDADHQRDKALLFFPGVVQFHKFDHCRFCAMTTRCDGVTNGWRHMGDKLLGVVGESA